MNAHDHVQVGLVGLPNTGKTSYLAAVLNATQESSAGSLKLARYPKQAAYLSEIQDAWALQKQVPHTAALTGELIRLELRMGDRTATLDIPDLSGESFRRLFRTRRLSDPLDELVQAFDGVLLFIHPDLLNIWISISDAINLGAKTPTSREAALESTLDLDLVPAELSAIDLIQAIRFRQEQTDTKRLGRVGIVVSAWDKLEGVGRVPHTWMRAQMPLLSSFLSNLESETSVFGVSAQGLEYSSTPADLDTATRAWVVDSDGTRHTDICRPLAWAAGLA